MGYRSQRARHRTGSLPVALVGRDGVVLLQGQGDVVQAVEQAVLDLRVDIEVGAASGPADLLAGQVEELQPVRDAAGRIDVQGTTQAITSVVEGWIREHPEQWLWLHRRWR